MTTVEAGRWIVMRSRVSLAGRVTASAGSIASGGALRLTAALNIDGQNETSLPRAIRRRYDTRIRPDGFYFFVDLPAGEYLLDGRDERGNEIEAREVSIPTASGSGPLHVVTVDLRAVTKPDTDAPTSDHRPQEPRGEAGPVRRRPRSRSLLAGAVRG
jgi:hypothetical protein